MNIHESIERLIAHIIVGGRFHPGETTLDLDELGPHGRSPLMVAAAQGHLEAVEWLLRRGASVSATGPQGGTALHDACANGHAEISGFLLDHGADVDVLTELGSTPLMCAAAWGYERMVVLLLERGANTSLVDSFGVTAADIAEEKLEEPTGSRLATLIEDWGASI